MTSSRDLAEVGARLGDSDGRLFKTALRAMASPQSGDVGSEEWEEFVAAQVYGAATRPRPNDALAFVETLTEIHGIDSVADVNDLLGRESFERQNYEGALAFAGAD